ncbi:DNA primase family protein [Methylobacter psychrophilus]|uniref:DNA primase family protein n=1 Tax=Methylobacter psychrophilus TaxID=96941 RepID=UPI0021D49F82|nr:phage/plasmid primase, P4 family [Methylobacter psychrophilus]
MLPDKIDDDEIVAAKKSSSLPSPPSLTRPADITPSSLNQKSDEENHDKESILAKKIANIFTDSLLFDEVNNEWYTQKNGLWTVTSEKKILQRIMPSLDAKLSEGYALCKLNNIKSFLSIYLLLDEWSSTNHLLPMLNGVLDTRTMTLVDYQPTHRFNWQLPYAYDKDARIDVIKRWLWLASGHDLEAVNIIRAFFKMALIGGDVQKFLELIGAGGTGKSTLVRLLVSFIGKKNHTVTDLKNLETNHFEAASLYGKRLAIINDSSRYGGEVSVLKAITGGDPVRLEKKNVQQSGSFEFDGVVVIASNEAIQSADYTSGLIRRRMPVNFNYKVTDADKAKWKAEGGIEKAMHNELAGLLNWVMKMTAEEVNKAIGGINGELTQVQREHLVETNKIAAWIDSNLIINPDFLHYVGGSMKRKKNDNEISSARNEKLYPNYELWCEDNNIHPVALQRFSSHILDVCEQVKIIVTGLPPNNKGKRIQGLQIRKDNHFKHATPITNKFFCDEEMLKGDERVMKQTRASDGSDDSDGINSFVKKRNIINDDTEIF